jgi:hypothetical protein
MTGSTSGYLRAIVVGDVALVTERGAEPAGSIMTVGRARELARQWVVTEACNLAGFCGAFLSGSTTWMADEAPLPATSDVDVVVVLEETEGPLLRGKFLHGPVLLEATYMPGAQLRTPELVLGQYHVAGSFRTNNIIMDPSGRLTRLQSAVAAGYARRKWVYRRCEEARDKVLRFLHSLHESDPFHDQVVAWLFGAGVTTHVLLVAGLENPTVRRRYVAVRELLVEYGHVDLYEPLLALLGCARMSRERVEHHLAALADAFDAVAAVVKTPLPFASDLTPIARPVAIDGSRELIESGQHREAIFWMVAPYSRCQKVFFHDAPAPMRSRFDEGYRQLLGELGIASFADLARRSEEVRHVLGRVWTVAEAMIAANRDIVD